MGLGLSRPGCWRAHFRFCAGLGTMNRVERMRSSAGREVRGTRALTPALSPGVKNAPHPALSPKEREWAREKYRQRGLQFGRFMESPLSLLRMHWDHEPGREHGPLSPTLSPSEGAREKHRQRALQCSREGSSCGLPIGNRRYSRLKTCATRAASRERFMGSPVSLSAHALGP